MDVFWSHRCRYESGADRGANFDRRIWLPIRESAGIFEDFKVYDLRHTQASLMIAAGVPMKVVQKRLGHREEIQNTNRRFVNEI